MHIILGATGHVGSALTNLLLEKGEPVTVVTHSPAKVDEWRVRGAKVALADVFDPAALRRVLHGGDRIFVLNPPAAPGTDTDAVEGHSVACILQALHGCRPDKIVAESTYGAQPARRAGDLGTLYDLERGLKALPAPVSIIRAAYYMSNWDAALAAAREQGVLNTMYPADFRLPMVAPADLGAAAARLMLEPVQREGIHYVEGPQQYTCADVAAAFAKALDRQVRVVTTPREQWVSAFESMGFSLAAAASYARMTAITLDRDYDIPDKPERGRTALQAYVDALVDSPVTETA